MGKKETQHRNVEWQDKLPSTYQIMGLGFHSDLTVAQFVSYLGDTATVPQEISHIKIANFTDEIYKHPALSKFWQTPVSVLELKKNHPEIHVALIDPDVKKVQESIKYQTGKNQGKPLFHFNSEKPTLETLARLLQAQDLGYKFRIAQLAGDEFIERVENLKKPEVYAKLQSLPWVKKLGVEKELPTKLPEFKVMNDKFKVKELESALRKAYEVKYTFEDGPDRDEKILAKFLESHKEYGTARVRDVLRTSIYIQRNNILKKDKHKLHTDVRNIMFIAGKSGEMGMTCEEFVDSVNAPPSSDAKDQYTTANMKGSYYHAGLDGTLLVLPYEIQIPYMRDDQIKATHDNMKESRKLNKKDPLDAELIKELEDERINTYQEGMPEEAKEKRKEYLDKLEHLKAEDIPPKECAEDRHYSPMKFMMQRLAAHKKFISEVAGQSVVTSLIVQEELNRSSGFPDPTYDVVFDKTYASRRAAMVALSKFPEEEAAANKKMKQGKSLFDTVTEISSPCNSEEFRKTILVLCQKPALKIVELNPAEDKKYKQKVSLIM